jgi:hypothetical protein
MISGALSNPAGRFIRDPKLIEQGRSGRIGRARQARLEQLDGTSRIPTR